MYSIFGVLCRNAVLVIGVTFICNYIKQVYILYFLAGGILFKQGVELGDSHIGTRIGSPKIAVGRQYGAEYYLYSVLFCHCAHYLYVGEDAL